MNVEMFELLTILVQTKNSLNPHVVPQLNYNPSIHILQLYLTYDTYIKASKVSNYNETHKWLLIAWETYVRLETINVQLSQYPKQKKIEIVTS